MCAEITSISFITIFRAWCRLCRLAVNTSIGPKPWDYTGADDYLSEERSCFHFCSFDRTYGCISRCLAVSFVCYGLQSCYYLLDPTPVFCVAVEQNDRETLETERSSSHPNEMCNHYHWFWVNWFELQRGYNSPCCRYCFWLTINKQVQSHCDHETLW